jgi:hypothetical protein
VPDYKNEKALQICAEPGRSSKAISPFFSEDVLPSICVINVISGF